MMQLRTFIEHNWVSSLLIDCRGFVSNKLSLPIFRLCRSLRHKFGWLFSALALCKAHKGRA